MKCLTKETYFDLRNFISDNRTFIRIAFKACEVL